MNLAISDSLGDPELTNVSLSKYLSLTREEIIAATKRHFNPENCSTLYYLPQNGN
jgi:hypothetical protein